LSHIIANIAVSIQMIWDVMASPPDAEQCFLPVEIIEEGPAQRPYVTELSILEIDLVGGHLFVQTATSSDW